MDYEKLYKEALERAKEYLTPNTPECVDTLSVITTIFPELAESEDEKIRKWCISHFKECINVIKDNNEYKEYLRNNVIAWLEKQKETDAKHDMDVWQHGYDAGFQNAEKQYEQKHDVRTIGYWNVQEVKQKPVERSEEDKRMFVNIKACLRNADKDYSKEIDWFMNLFHQSKQRWSDEDEEKRKKIMHILSLDGRINNKELSSINDWLKSLRPQPKQEWSKEDERNLQGIIDEIKANKNNAPDYDLATYDRFLSWLKTLKDRVYPKQAWSEEEEKIIKRIVADLEQLQRYCKYDLGKSLYIEEINWLNSLKEKMKEE